MAKFFRANSKLISLGGIVLILLFSFIASAEEYMATMVNTTRDGAYEGRIYVSNDKVNIQSYDFTLLIRGDRKSMWKLYPKTKKFKESRLEPLYLVATSAPVPGETQRTHVGKGRFGGKLLEKYQVTYKYEGKVDTVFQWFEEGSSIPVRTATQDGMWSIELKNIRAASQPYDLFEIPKGYKEEGAKYAGD